MFWWITLNVNNLGNIKGDLESKTKKTTHSSALGDLEEQFSAFKSSSTSGWKHSSHFFKTQFWIQFVYSNYPNSTSISLTCVLIFCFFFTQITQPINSNPSGLNNLSTKHGEWEQRLKKVREKLDNVSKQRRYQNE